VTSGFLGLYARVCSVQQGAYLHQLGADNEVFNISRLLCLQAAASSVPGNGERG
jgi:hypothetical protein